MMEVPSRSARFELFDDDGSLRLVWDDAVVTGPDARAAVRAVGRRLTADTHALLVDMRRSGPMDRAARQAFAEATGPRRVALLVRSTRSRMLASFFLGLHRTRMPLQVFDDEAAARAWLRSAARST